MKCVALFLAVAIFVAVEAAPEPGVHRVTGKYITHIHRYTYRVTGRPGRGGKGNGGGGSGGNGGKGGKGTKCQQGLIDGTAGELNKGFNKLTSGIANTFGANKKNGGLIGNIFGGAKTALDRIAGGARTAVSDFFCGFNSVFNKVGSQLGKGNIGGALAGGVNTFVTGADKFFGNIASNAVGAVGSGVNRALGGYANKG